MSYAEKRGNLWRARWHGPDGTLESKPGFRTRKDAETTAERTGDAAANSRTAAPPGTRPLCGRSFAITKPTAISRQPHRSPGAAAPLKSLPEPIDLGQAARYKSADTAMIH